MQPTRFTIEFCEPKDVAAVKRFIHEHWRAGHILSVDDMLFRWQHFDRERNRYGIALARDHGGAIVGMLGFICDRFFRRSSRQDNSTIWLAMWKVLDTARGVGLRLRYFIETEETPRLIAAVGLNPRTLPLYQSFGYRVGTMDQYYLVSNACRPRLIQHFDGRYDSGTPVNGRRSLVRLKRRDQLRGFCAALPIEDDVLPVKDAEYLEGRYLDHPIYAYQFYGVMDSVKPVALLVTRRAEANGAVALRIVDVVGRETALEGMRSVLQSLLAEQRAEYADLYCFGLSAGSMERAGFLLHDPHGPQIVPNYFEPFAGTNVQITLAYKVRGSYRYIAFRGDADQDRPNVRRQPAEPTSSGEGLDSQAPSRSIRASAAGN
jgi:hypothetical protein